MRGSVRIACLAFALAGLGDEVASAQGAAPALELEWVAPLGCSSREAVVDKVASLLGSSRPPSARRPLRVHAEVWRGESGRWHIVMTTPGEAGRREIEDVSCEALARAAALVLALRIDPIRALRASPAGAAPTPEGDSAEPDVLASATPPDAPHGEHPEKAASAEHDPPPVAPAPVPATPPATASITFGAHEAAPEAAPPEKARPPRRRQLAVGASFAGNTGAFPSATPGAELTLAWVPSRIRLELGGSYWLAQQTTVAQPAGAGADVRSMTLEARGCYSVLVRRFSLAPCAEAQVVWMWVSGFGASQPLDANAGWVALGAGALGRWQISDILAVRLRLDAMAPTTHPRFVIDTTAGEAVGVVHRPAALYGDAVLGAELFFL